MSDDLFRIVYCSRNAIGGDCAQEELAQILTVSRHNNARDGVTGSLLYSRGIFAQTLEGPFEAVQRTFERIQTDDRHVDVVLLQAEIVESRTFAAWAMAQATPDDPARAQAVLARALAKDNRGAPHDVLALLDRLVRQKPTSLITA